ncbi:MAG: ArsR/SmtB family transcription factor [Beijerinckiaceae bacterium]
MTASAAPVVAEAPPVSAEIQALMANARRASDFLKALSHENRLLLLCLLAEKERSVGELEDLLGLRQSAVSQQLARLRLDGLVSARRDGKAVHYSLATPEVRAVLEVMHRVFCAKRL